MAITTSHHTIHIERMLPAAPARVFAAWSDADALGRWYLPGDGGWRSEILAHDFVVGGRKYLSFGPPDGPTYFEDCRYEDIVADARICSSMTILREDERVTTSMVTAEFLPDGNTCRLIVTDQLVLLSGEDNEADRERGWGETLDKLMVEIKR
ncbi:MAG: polyketide cyclase [Alphaproteobacteria bacterium]|nr:polyketide cyclase [Alphaproteobacteria bacterium]